MPDEPYAITVQVSLPEEIPAQNAKGPSYIALLLPNGYTVKVAFLPEGYLKNDLDYLITIMPRKKA